MRVSSVYGCPYPLERVRENDPSSESEFSEEEF